MRTSFEFSATVVADGDELQALLKPGVGQVVLDLSLGAWTPHGLASQWLGQLLGKEVAPKAKAAKSTATLSLGDSMSAGIDQEGRGNRTLLTAYQTAQQIAGLLRQRASAVCIIAPAFGQAWRQDDRLLVEYLLQLEPRLDLQFAVLTGQAPLWPEGWDVRLDAGSGNPVPPTGNPGLLARLPGVVGPRALAAGGAQQRSALMVLDNGWAVVRPEWRRAPHQAQFTRAEVEALPALGLRDLTGYALYHSGRAPRDCWLFCQEAWKQFDAGYKELSYLFIEAALRHADDAHSRGVFTCHRQAMLLACAQYEAAGTAPEPAAGLPPDMRCFLLETKGWGLVMANRPAEALPHLRQALAMSQPEVPDVPYMFLLNITALAEVRSGNHATALTLENRIEGLIREHGLDEARLKFVNWLNLARLARYGKDLDRAEHYYNLAFSTVEGARSETDSINANLCHERIAHGRGQQQAALLCWVRAAMHWCASDCPEALNWRIQNLVLGQPGRVDLAGSADIVRMVEDLAGAFLSRLRGSSESAGCPVDSDGVTARSFHFHDQLRAARLHGYAGGAGWAVMLGEGGPAKRSFGPRYAALQAWLTAWVRQAGAGDAPCYVVDRGLGGEMPLDWEQMLASAIERGVGQLVFEGRPLVLDTEQRAALSRQRRLLRNPIVARVAQDGEHPVVHFKRYFEPYVLNPQERALLDAAGSDSLDQVSARLCRDGADAAQLARTLAGLQQRRIVQVGYGALPGPAALSA
jgi:hypothetical protein